MAEYEFFCDPFFPVFWHTYGILGFELIITIFITFILYKEFGFSKAYLQY